MKLQTLNSGCIKRRGCDLPVRINSETRFSLNSHKLTEYMSCRPPITNVAEMK
jgi:hypothetical protein